MIKSITRSLLATTAKRVNRVTNRVMSPGTIVNRTSRRIDRFRAGWRERQTTLNSIGQFGRF